jgi:hypothetical protein
MALGEAARRSVCPSGAERATPLGSDIGAGARPVLDDELLAKPLRQRLTQEACDDVGCAAGGEADDDAHRARRIGLRPSDMRHGRERGSACGLMKKLSTVGKFHDVLRHAAQWALGSLRLHLDLVHTV